MNTIWLEAKKPDGTPHQTWDGEILAQSNDWLVVYTPIGTTVRHHTRDLSYTMQHSNLGLFSAKEYYNVFIDFLGDGSFKRLYINVAMPATWDKSTVSWIDLDLDVLVYPNKKPELIDQDEFDEAVAAGHITHDLAVKAQSTGAMLLEQADSGSFPFIMQNYDEALRMISRLLWKKRVR